MAGLPPAGTLPSTRGRPADAVRHQAAPKLIYLQVADHIAGRIAAGELQPGARLPAERDMATEYGVAYDTIRRATAVLRERGLITTIVGRGTFVTAQSS